MWGKMIKQQAIENSLNELFIDDIFQAVIIANEEGLPIASRINPFSKEVEFFLSAVVSTMACTGLNIAETLAMGGPDGIKIDLKKGTMYVKNIAEDAYCGILIKKPEKNTSQVESQIAQFVKDVNLILFPVK
jgi:predicted regulator of Ras-like GTPase activity (Roadblock/LC7/MglB family)